MMRSLYCFKEVKQNWLGYTQLGNDGAGLGPDFARSLHRALGGVLKDFGCETVTQGSHLEKLTLVGSGVGQDNISDFTTNLVKGWLCEYTQSFARQHLAADKREEFPVVRAEFDYATETWATRRYELPAKDGDYVLLTPAAILTRHHTWINHGDMVNRITRLPEAVSDAEQRAKIDAYLCRKLGDNPTRKQKTDAAQAVVEQFPELIDLYVRIKEDEGEKARSVSADEVLDTRRRFVEAVRAALGELTGRTEFFDAPWTSYEECLARVDIFKRWIEHEDGYKLFNPRSSRPPSKEADLQLAFKLVWAGSQLDVNAEVNNGRGPVDFKASLGSGDKSLIEFKLASNNALKRNLQNQVAIYEQANGTRTSVKVIVCFTAADQRKVDRVLKELGLQGEDAVVVINARNDDKRSASNA